MTVEFRILGPLEVIDSGGSVALPARKPRVVLLRLLVGAGSAVPADALADALWGDQPPAPSSLGESHPQALTEPYVTISRYTALVVLVTRPWGRG